MLIYCSCASHSELICLIPLPSLSLLELRVVPYTTAVRPYSYGSRYRTVEHKICMPDGRTICVQHDRVTAHAYSLFHLSPIASIASLTSSIASPLLHYQPLLPFAFQLSLSLACCLVSSIWCVSLWNSYPRACLLSFITSYLPTRTANTQLYFSYQPFLMRRFLDPHLKLILYAELLLHAPCGPKLVPCTECISVHVHSPLPPSLPIQHELIEPLNKSSIICVRRTHSAHSSTVV